MPSERSFWSRNASRLAGLSRAFVSWNSNDLFADPPPLATNRNSYVLPPVAEISIWAGRLVPELTSSYMDSGHRLGVPQVLPLIGLEDPAGEPLLIVHAGPDALALLGDDRGRAGVLAHRQPEAGGDGGVPEQGQGDAAVVGRGLGVVEDRGDLREVRRAVEERDVAERLACQYGERLGGDLEDLLSFERAVGDVLRGEEAVRVASGPSGKRSW